MKPIVVVVFLLFAASLMQAQTPPSTTAPAGKAPVVKSAPTKTPPAPAKKVEKKKEEPLPVIPGTEIARANGTFLGLQVVDGNFKLSFYDKKKKAMAVDVDRAIARWPNPRAPGDNRTVLNPSGNALVGQKPVVPPFTFTVFLSLLQGEGETAKVESYVVAFRG